MVGRTKAARARLLMEQGNLLSYITLHLTYINPKHIAQSLEEIAWSKLSHMLRRKMWYNGNEQFSIYGGGFQHQAIETSNEVIKHQGQDRYNNFGSPNQIQSQIGWFFWFFTIHFPIRPNLKVRTDTTIQVRRTRYRTKLGGLFGSSRYILPIRSNLVKHAKIVCSLSATKFNSSISKPTCHAG